MPRENRTAQAMVNVEPSLLDVITLLANKEGLTVSSLGRKLFMERAIERGLLTATQIQEYATS